jgi:hypothetical protein
MQITVQARSMRGHPQLARAGRFWPTTSAKLVEVLEQEEDPPEITVAWRNPTTGKDEPRKRPDPDRIGQKTYRMLLEDTRLVIKETGAINQQAADAAIASAREEVTRLSAMNLELKSRVAALESGDAFRAMVAENEELKSKIVDLQLLIEMAKQASGSEALGSSEEKTAGETPKTKGSGKKG